MPARLSGVLDWSGGIVRDGALDVQWAAAYPAVAPWRRDICHAGKATLALDTRGGSRLSDCFARDPATGSAVAGTIRLDDIDDLRAELAGASTPSIGAAELILAGYRRRGRALFSRLAGDFSFLLWDEPEQTGYLVRDPFGVRRLHYAQHRDGLVFSTDVEGVLAWPGLDRGPDEVTILDNLLARYRTRERTFFRAIKRVPPGHHLIAGAGCVAIARHREIPRHDVSLRSLEEYAEAFRFQLARAVKERLPAGGVVACHVSGGLDSTSMATLAHAELARQGRPLDLALVTARFFGSPTDEGFVAHELSRRLGVPIGEWDGRVPETSDLERPRLAWPFGRSSIAGAQQGDLELAEQAGASIIFSGSGGNQIAAERGFFDDAWREGGAVRYMGALVDVACAGLWRWPQKRQRRTLFEARRAIPGGASFKRRSYQPTIESSRCDWLGPRLREVWGMLPEIPAPALEPRTGSWMAESIWDELVEDPVHVWTLEHEDARATERGLEFRFPYLSWALLNLTLSVPARLRPPAEVDRSLQRLALRGVLPDRLRLRNTFVDFREAIMSNTQAAVPWIEQLLASGPWLSEGRVDRRVALRTLGSLRAQARSPFSDAQADGWREIRDMAALEAWLRQV